MLDKISVENLDFEMISVAYRHIPTMTNSHHGGFLSVMIMVGICQWQNPTMMKMMKNFNFLIIRLSSTGLKFFLLLTGQFGSIWEENMFVQHNWLF